MKKIFAYVKANPVMVIGLVAVGALVLWMLLRGGGGGGTTVVSGGGVTGPVDNTLALAQLQAQVQREGIGAGIEMQRTDVLGQLELAKIQATLGAQSIGAQLQGMLAGLASQDYAVAANRDVQLAGVMATLQGQRDQLAATVTLGQQQTDLNRFVFEQQTVQSGQNLLTQIAMAGINADVLKTQLTQQTNMFTQQITQENNDGARQACLASLENIRMLAVTKPVWWRDTGSKLYGAQLAAGC